MLDYQYCFHVVIPRGWTANKELSSLHKGRAQDLESEKLDSSIFQLLHYVNNPEPPFSYQWNGEKNNKINNNHLWLTKFIGLLWGPYIKGKNLYAQTLAISQFVNAKQKKYGNPKGPPQLFIPQVSMPENSSTLSQLQKDILGTGLWRQRGFLEWESTQGGNKSHLAIQGTDHFPSILGTSVRLSKEKPRATVQKIKGKRFKRKTKLRAFSPKQSLENCRTGLPQETSGKILL